MLKSKVIEIFNHLSPQERKELRSFVYSKFHNQHKEVMKLYDFILSRKEITSKSVSKERAFQHLFGNVTYDNMRLIHIISYLGKIMEDFLAYQEWNHQTYQKKRYVIQALRKRRMEKQLNKKIREFDKVRQKTGIEDTDYYFHRYKVEIEHTRFITEQKRNVGTLQNITDSLNIYFIAEKLKQVCINLSNKIVNVQDYEFDLLPLVLEQVGKNNKYKNIPTIHIYYTGYKLLTEPNDKHFNQFKSQLLQFGYHFQKGDLRDLYLMAINYAIRQLNTGKENALHQLFELYKTALASQVVIQDGIISRLTFINIVSVGVKAKEFDWTQTFIDEYKVLLEEKYKESIYSYTQAKLFYVQKKYKEAMLLLMQTDFDEFLIHLDGKLMLLKMFYELGEINSLDALLDSMRTYVHRKKVIGYHKTNYLNIISITKKLIRLMPNDSNKKEKLREEIKSKEILTARDWLLERLEGF